MPQGRLLSALLVFGVGCAYGGVGELRDPSTRDAGQDARTGSDSGEPDAFGPSDAGTDAYRAPVPCTDGCALLDTQCTIGLCNTSTGFCEDTAVANGTECDDGSRCTDNDRCTSGVCTGAVRECAPAAQPCRVNQCNPATGECELGVGPDRSACDDGDPCTDADECLGGTCRSGDVTDCSHLVDECNTAECNAIEGCRAVPVAEGIACTGGSCRGGECRSVCRWLLISQESQFSDSAVQGVFTSEGYPIEVRTNNGTSGTYSADSGLFGAHTHAVLHLHDRVLTSSELSVLNAFINNGGHLIVTGYDSLGSPTDTVLGGLVRCDDVADGPFVSTLTIANATHPIAMGPSQTFSLGETLTAASTDHDECEPATGATRIVAVGGSSKVQIAESLGPGAGTVVYWNGNGVGGGSLEDWTGSDGGTQPALQNLLRNTLDYLCR